MIVSQETYEWLLKKLEEPPKVIPEMVKLFAAKPFDRVGDPPVIKDDE